uniref:Uncharacterized protein n=1 Tax=Chromera velia CCMP2878 TaxID=1169474 RepID=A0A0G4HFR9_9ALVE|eukprot:Cvel_27168.t1-p1 / transcript=Cvel_27168.t1 / gene=Cvel_27168 / organism=Chromera_velia_CCMP2878 / gene_product=hypothetical protein / transcript_product=hypothetical protein / location=Cvel_scaffold3347:800-3810(+) / protein_length=546 / sequence_SO=supercontig / SO=protein_coding / is_pseudo=false
MRGLALLCLFLRSTISTCAESTRKDWALTDSGSTSVSGLEFAETAGADNLMYLEEKEEKEEKEDCHIEPGGSQCSLRVRVVNSYFHFHTEVVEGLIEQLHHLGHTVLFNEDLGHLPTDILTKTYKRSDGPAEVAFFTTADTIEAEGLDLLPEVISETGAKVFLLLVHELFNLHFVKERLDRFAPDLPSDLSIHLVALHPHVARRIGDSMLSDDDEDTKWIPQVSRNVSWLFIAKSLPIVLKPPESTQRDDLLLDLLGRVQCQSKQEFKVPNGPQRRNPKSSRSQNEFANTLARTAQEGLGEGVEKTPKTRRLGKGKGRRRTEKNWHRSKRKPPPEFEGVAMQGILDDKRRNYKLLLKALLWYRNAKFCFRNRFFCYRSRLFWYRNSSLRFEKTPGGVVSNKVLSQNEMNPSLHLRAVGRVEPWFEFDVPEHLKEDTRLVKFETDIVDRRDFVLYNSCTIALLTGFPSDAYRNGTKTSSTIQLALSTGWWTRSYISFFELLESVSWGEYLDKRAAVERAHRRLTEESAQRMQDLLGRGEAFLHVATS